MEVVERSTYLERLPYLENRDRISGFNVSFEPDGGGKIEYFAPSDDKRDSILLTLRLFLQQGDKISFASLRELHKDPGVSDAWKAEHSAIRARLKKQLNGPSLFKSDGTIVRRYKDVLDVVLNGKVAHYDPGQRKTLLYEQWTSTGSASLLHHQFHQAVLMVLEATINLGRASKEELERAR